MTNSNTLRQPPKFRNGNEPFQLRGRSAKFTLYDFWQWLASDVVYNIHRGAVAEYIVAQALGVAADYPRAPFESCDLQIHTKVSEFVDLEVKCAAYVQSWHRVDSRPSVIGFNLEPKAGSTALTGKPSRDAHVYIFCVLGEPDVFPDPLDLGQWEFYILPAVAIDEEIPKQKTIRLSPLQKMVRRRGQYTANYDELSNSIEKVIRCNPPKGAQLPTGG